MLKNKSDKEFIDKINNSINFINQFEKKLKMVILPNKDKQVEITFTIIDIIDDLMSKTVRENLQDIHEKLTMWSINEGLVINFNFKIKR